MSASKTVLVMVVTLGAILSGCGHRTTLLPQSTGQPYEVVVCGDRDSTVSHSLSAPLSTLPQPEPAFDVWCVSSIDGASRYARSIVQVSIDSTLYSRTHIRYDKNVYAEPQLVVYVNAPTLTALRNEWEPLASRLTDLLTRHEMNIAISYLRQHHHVAGEQSMLQSTGHRVLLPSDLTHSKTAPGFAWFSDDDGRAMQSVCVFTLPWDCDLLASCDSVTQQHIKGETDSMYLRIVAGSIQRRMLRERHHAIEAWSGLWEMEGDAMGGPFVLHALRDSARRQTVVAEAFVFAPSTKKRNVLRAVEAALYTLE